MDGSNIIKKSVQSIDMLLLLLLLLSIHTNITNSAIASTQGSVYGSGNDAA